MPTLRVLRIEVMFEVSVFEKVVFISCLCLEHLLTLNILEERLKLMPSREGE